MMPSRAGRWLLLYPYSRSARQARRRLDAWRSTAPNVFPRGFQIHPNPVKALRPTLRTRIRVYSDGMPEADRLRFLNLDAQPDR